MGFNPEEGRVLPGRGLYRVDILETGLIVLYMSAFSSLVGKLVQATLRHAHPVNSPRYLLTLTKFQLHLNMR